MNKESLSTGGLLPLLNKFLSFSEDKFFLEVLASSSSAAEVFISCVLAQKKHLKRTGKNKFFIVLSSEKALDKWYQILRKNLKSYKICRFFHLNLWGQERLLSIEKKRGLRLECLAALLNNDACVVLTTAQALQQKIVKPKDFQSDIASFYPGMKYDLEDFISYLESIAYIKVEQIDSFGTYALRGGIVDVFSAHLENPLRFEFSESEIVSIRLFSLSEQSSFSILNECILIPAREVLIRAKKKKELLQKLYTFLLENQVLEQDLAGIISSFRKFNYFREYELFSPLFCDRSASLLDFFSAKASIFFMPEGLAKLIKTNGEFRKRVELNYQEDQAYHYPSLHPSQHYLDDSKLLELCAKESYSLVSFVKETYKDNFSSERYFLKLPIPHGASCFYSSNRQESFLAIKKLLKEGWSFCFFIQDKKELVFLEEILADFKIHLLNETWVEFFSSGKHTVSEASLYAVEGDLSEPFFAQDLNFILLPATILIGKRQTSYASSRKKVKEIIHSFRDICVDDLLVHEDYGVGLYKGLINLNLTGAASDFIQLEYQGGDKIYVPVERLNLVHKYQTTSKEKNLSHVDKLRTKNFKKRKGKVQAEVEAIAKKLLEMAAQRQIFKGSLYSLPSADYRAICDDFPYQETSDQISAIAAIEEDMRSPLPMERIIVGDVGFGKTEVALRAAAYAVLEGYQVLYLCPTTVLCHQHLQTFKERLSLYGFRVEALHRFIKVKEQKSIANDFTQAKIDILIGTHRLLAKDIKPANLGLVVVDEEQKFGVLHKEKVKAFSPHVDLLTLTATPIPRTLHMAMIGLKKISLLEEAPRDRLPIHTLVSVYKETIIQEACQREIARSGQVFIVHNNVSTIEQFAKRVRELLPFARIAVGHGQMLESRLEKTIIDFLEHRYDILVCTTIIESGIDMPRVNTLLINKAEMFGLAQLYQLRGRVGRSNIQAYAYLLTTKELSFEHPGRKRLEIIESLTGLGMGFQLASADLSTRGIGNLLGTDQSGCIDDVGFELFSEMLEEEILSLSGKKKTKKDPVELQIPFAMFIPAAFIHSERERLNLYRQLSRVEEIKELSQLESSLIDRFGSLPKEFRLLMKLTHLKILAESCAILKIRALEKKLYEFSWSLENRDFEKFSQEMSHKEANIYLKKHTGKFIFFSTQQEDSSLYEEKTIQGLINTLQKFLLRRKEND